MRNAFDAIYISEEFRNQFMCLDPHLDSPHLPVFEEKFDHYIIIIIISFIILIVFFIIIIIIIVLANAQE